MKKIKADWADHILAIIIVIVLWIAVDAIIKTARAQYEYDQAYPYKQKEWQPRQIPKCDKELWLRIKDGCS